MEREAIERLAMDAALGELSEDAKALLDLYLAEHPDAKQWAQQMTRLCTQTQSAIREKTQSKTEPSCVFPTTQRQSSSVPWMRLARWAAVVTVSLIAGAGVGRWSAPEASVLSPYVAAETIRNAGPRNWREIMSRPADGFWESKAAAIRNAEPRRNISSQPSLWETLKQLQKERNHG
jgi:hypothetical protein